MASLKKSRFAGRHRQGNHLFFLVLSRFLLFGKNPAKTRVVFFVFPGLKTPGY
jgi:hypothetical protein